MKKLAVLFIINCCLTFVANAHNSWVLNETWNNNIHETWRVSFACDGSCEKNKCSLELNTSKNGESVVVCTCESCDVTSKVSAGNVNDISMSQAKKSLAKSAIWKMMQVEIKQKYAGTNFKVNRIDVALNHGKTIVFFNCLFIDDNKEVIIKVVDMFN